MLSRRPPLLPAGLRGALRLLDRERGGREGRRIVMGCRVGPIFFSQGPFQTGWESNSTPRFAPAGPFLTRKSGHEVDFGL